MYKSQLFAYNTYKVLHVAPLYDREFFDWERWNVKIDIENFGFQEISRASFLVVSSTIIKSAQYPVTK